MSIETTRATTVMRTALTQSVPIGSRIPTIRSSVVGADDEASVAPASRPTTNATSAIHVTRRMSAVIREHERVNPVVALALDDQKHQLAAVFLTTIRHHEIRPHTGERAVSLDANVLEI